MDDNNKSSLSEKLSSVGRISKKFLRAGLLASLILVPTCGGVSYMAKWIYKVKTNYGVVVTQANAERVAETEPGWYVRTPVISEFEGEFALANQMMFLNGKEEPHQVIARDSVVIMAAATTFFEIDNLKQHAIENVTQQSDRLTPGGIDPKVTPQNMIQRNLDSIINAYMQRTPPEKLIQERDKAEKEVYQELIKSDVQEQYGIKITSFKFTKTSLISEVVRANAKKQELVALAEGEKSAADVKKATIETLATAESKRIELVTAAEVDYYKRTRKAFNPKTPKEEAEFNAYFSTLVKYRTLKENGGNTVWVLPEGGDMKPVYNPGKSR